MKTVSVGHKIYAGLVISLFLIPEIAAIALPLENWPFTSAPMFAHYVGPQTPRYYFRFIGEYPERRKNERQIRAMKLGLKEWELMRHFFGKVYGSIDPRAPWGHFPNDTRETFEMRLSRFFHGLTVQLERKKKARKYAKGLRSLRLEVVRLDSQDQPVEVHRVGRYFVGEDRFVHEWGRK